MRKAEILMAAGIVVTAALMLWQALKLPITWTSIGPGAGVFPFWLSVGVALSAVVVFVQSLRAGPGNGETFLTRAAAKPLLIVFLPIVAVIFFLDYLGIYIGGSLYLAGYMWLVGRHRITSIVLVSILLPLALFFIFEKWFLLPMPKGELLEYLLYER